MFEFHGWVTIQDSTEEVDFNRLNSIVDQIRERIQNEDWGSAFVDLRWININPQLHVAGLPNRPRGVEGEGIVQLFRYIAEVAPGSYGLLYTRDDEAAEYVNVFRAFVMRRGRLTEESDPFFSPVVPTIEDE